MMLRTLITVMLVLICAVVATGCSAGPVPPTNTQSIPAPTTKATEVPASPTQPPAHQEPTPVETPEDHSHATRGDALYSDDFTDPGSGWQKAKIDNYFIGYHEPDYYHVDVHVPHDNYEAILPDHSFTDFTAEAKVFADEANTAAEGDFRYGLVLRRSGKQYYAFTLSPRTRTWYVLKSSPQGIEVLEQGANAAQGVKGEDMLRIDAVGDTLAFTVNGRSVSQVKDVDYPSGQIGFYVETFDAPRAHVHFDSLTVRPPDRAALAPAKAASQPTTNPGLACRVVAPLLDLRSQPDPSTGTSIVRLARNIVLKPLARSADAQWIKVLPVGFQSAGWVAFGPGYTACDFVVADLPVGE